MFSSTLVELKADKLLTLVGGGSVLGIKNIFELPMGDYCGRTKLSERCVHLSDRAKGIIE